METLPDVIGSRPRRPKSRRSALALLPGCARGEPRSSARTLHFGAGTGDSRVGPGPRRLPGSPVASRPDWSGRPSRRPLATHVGSRTGLAAPGAGAGRAGSEEPARRLLWSDPGGTGIRTAGLGTPYPCDRSRGGGDESDQEAHGGERLGVQRVRRRRALSLPALPRSRRVGWRAPYPGAARTAHLAPDHQSASPADLGPPLRARAGAVRLRRRDRRCREPAARARASPR